MKTLSKAGIVIEYFIEEMNTNENNKYSEVAENMVGLLTNMDK